MRSALSYSRERLGSSELYPDSRSEDLAEWSNSARLSSPAPGPFAPYLELGFSWISDPELLSPGASRSILGEAALGIEGAIPGSASRYFLRIDYSQGLEGYSAASASAGVSLEF